MHTAFDCDPWDYQFQPPSRYLVNFQVTYIRSTIKFTVVWKLPPIKSKHEFVPNVYQRENGLFPVVYDRSGQWQAWRRHASWVDVLT